MAYHYALLLNPPKEVQITSQQFKKLSFMGVASLFCNYKVVFDYQDNGDIEMTCCQRTMVDKCLKNHRFKEIGWFYSEEAELYYCIIPKDNPLVGKIEKYFNHLITKSE